MMGGVCYDFEVSSSTAPASAKSPVVHVPKETWAQASARELREEFWPTIKYLTRDRCSYLRFLGSGERYSVVLPFRVADADVVAEDVPFREDVRGDLQPVARLPADSTGLYCPQFASAGFQSA